MKVRELKKLLEKYDDEVEIITSSSNYELNGNRVKARIIETKCSLQEKNFRDDFDGTRYTKQVYTSDENGQIVLWIMG